MQRTWNFCYYATWKLLGFLGEVLIEKPLISFFNSVPTLKRNWNKGKRNYEQVMYRKESGFNIGFAYRYMLFATTIIYASFCLFFVHVFNIQVGKNISYYFFAVLAISYLTNYFLLHRSDVYKKHFKKFEKAKNKPVIYLSAILFHLGVIGFGILSVHFTVGFNF